MAVNYKSELAQSGLLLIEFQQEWLSPQGKLHHLFNDKNQYLNSLVCAEKVIMESRDTPIHIIHSGLTFSAKHTELGAAKYGLRAGIASAQTFLRNTFGSEFAAPFKPQDNEFVVSGRTGGSAFSGSNLDGYLRNNQIQTLYLMGYALHVCVESTFRAAHDLGYDVVLIEDAVAAFSADQKRYVLSEVVHHFGKSITSKDYLNYIRGEKMHENK